MRTVLEYEGERFELKPIFTRAEFLSRFKSRLRDILGEHYDAKYVDEIAPTYWDDESQRAEGPEECAEAERLSGVRNRIRSKGAA